MSYSEVKELPTAYRQWFLKRLVREFNEKNELVAGSSSNNRGEDMNKLREYENMLSKKT